MLGTSPSTALHIVKKKYENDNFAYITIRTLREGPMPVGQSLEDTRTLVRVPASAPHKSPSPDEGFLYEAP